MNRNSLHAGLPAPRYWQTTSVLHLARLSRRPYASKMVRTWGSRRSSALSRWEASNVEMGNATSSIHATTGEGRQSLSQMPEFTSCSSINLMRSLNKLCIRMLKAMSASGDPGREPLVVVKHVSEFGRTHHVFWCASWVALARPGETWSRKRAACAWMSAVRTSMLSPSSCRASTSFQGNVVPVPNACSRRRQRKADLTSMKTVALEIRRCVVIRL